MSTSSTGSRPCGLFVAGTDTGVGKTWVSLGLMAALQARGLRAVGFKPVASGSRRSPEGLRNEDAVHLLAQSSGSLAYADVNPYAFEPPIAPHIAAAETGARISLDTIASAYQRVATDSDVVIVEGVGGWLVPLDDRRTTADLAVHLNLPVILVVAIRLGCLNHALLSVESIRRCPVPLAGWVANHPDGIPDRAEENIAALTARIDAPLLAVVPPSASPAAEGMAEHMAAGAEALWAQIAPPMT